MPSHEWFLHIQGDTFGPIGVESLGVLLKHGRVQFTDYAWSEGLEGWTRLSDLRQFIAYIPSYPAAPLPVATKESSPKLKIVDPSFTEAVEIAEDESLRASSDGGQVKSWIMRYGRARVQARATVETHGAYEVVDISEGGLFLKAKQPLPFGTDLSFRLESPFFPEPMMLTGIVIREGVSDYGEEGFAIRFTRLNPAYRRMIHDYVKSHHPKAQNQ